MLLVPQEQRAQCRQIVHQMKDLLDKTQDADYASKPTPYSKPTAKAYLKLPPRLQFGEYYTESPVGDAMPAMTLVGIGCICIAVCSMLQLWAWQPRIHR
jgi:hypothetical protein